MAEEDPDYRRLQVLQDGKWCLLYMITLSNYSWPHAYWRRIRHTCVWYECNVRRRRRSTSQLRRRLVCKEGWDKSFEGKVEAGTWGGADDRYHEEVWRTKACSCNRERGRGPKAQAWGGGRIQTGSGNDWRTSTSEQIGESVEVKGAASRGAWGHRPQLVPLSLQIAWFWREGLKEVPKGTDSWTTLPLHRQHNWQDPVWKR